MKKTILLLAVVFVVSSLAAGHQVDTITVMAQKMQKAIKNVVIKPEDYSKKKKYPVVYLLHGFGDSYAKWVNTVPEIKELATMYETIIVCPDAAKSWYMDSPKKPEIQYESYIISDLVRYIDTHYAAKTEATSRAITGLSMGGHGALYLAIKHPDIFGNVGSMSGGVDLRYSTKQWDINQLLGPYESNGTLWDDRSVINMVNTLKNKQLNIIIDCGVNDFFYQINAALHRRLMTLNIDHDYTERPGEHNWNYWQNAIKYQLLYFSGCFNKKQLK